MLIMFDCMKTILLMQYVVVSAQEKGLALRERERLTKSDET